MMAIPAVAALLLAVIDAFGLSLLDVSFAFAFCVAGAMASHVLNEFPKGDEFMMTRLMTSMFVRAGLPLIAVVLAKMVFESAFSEGFVYLVVLFYLVGLISDSVLSTIRLRSQ